jgi:hypothetical protein
MLSGGNQVVSIKVPAMSAGFSYLRIADIITDVCIKELVNQF